jgi:polysaccharide biosynthesis transport protein
MQAAHRIAILSYSARQRLQLLMVEPMLHDRNAGITGPLIQYSSGSTPSRPDDARVDLKELARIVKSQHRSILLTAAVPVVITLAYILMATPLYTAYTQILMDPRDRRIVSNEVNPEVLAADGGVAVVESQLLVITSDIVLQRVIARERLDVDPEFGGISNDFLSVFSRRILTAIGMAPDATDGADPRLKALRQIKRKISVKRSEKAFVADVFVTSESKDKSVRIADAIARSYLDDQAEARSAASHRASSELSARLETLRNRVREAEDRVVEYKKQHHIISAGGLLVNEQQLSEMNIQLNAARTRIAEARSRFEQIQRAKQAGVDPGAIPEAVQSQTIGLLRGQYAEVIRQRADLTGRLGPRHPDVLTLNAQIRDLQGLVDKELTRIATAAQSEVARAEASERAIKAGLENLKAEAISTSQASVQLRELERESEASRGIYQAFLVRARETGEQQSIDSTNARVISQASPPRDKSWPPRGILLMGALVAGLGIGTGIGLMRDYLDETVNTRRQLEGLIPVPVLAVLPQLSPEANHGPGLLRLLNGHDLNPAKRKNGGEFARGADGPLDQLTSSIRTLLSAIYRSNKFLPGRTILISSSEAAEGKTTVALNVALEAAGNGGRVLLVDADFNGHTLSKNPAARARAGLFDLLEGRVKLSSAVLSQSETGLQFLALGNATRAESYQPMPETIAQKLVEPARNFDLIVIDCGSVLTDGYVRPFADAADDILFVVRAGTTRKDNILSAFAALRLNSRKCRGTILASAKNGFA